MQAVLVAVLAAGAVSCGAIKGMALKSVANSLAATGTTITSYDDPDTIEGAIPFTITLYESMLADVPKHEPLLTATCAIYTQYAFGFIAPKAEVLDFAGDFTGSQDVNARALKLAIHGRDLCWRALEVRFRGVSAQLKKDPAAALSRAQRKHVPLLYWSAASLGAAISVGGLDRPDLINQWPLVRALAERALALDETWNDGALHELMITVESQGEALGGSEDRARKHYARALEIQKGLSPGPHVALAMGVVKTRQNKAEFEKLMKAALAVDAEKNPAQRLVVLLTQRRAKVLLDNVDKIIIAPFYGHVMEAR